MKKSVKNLVMSAIIFTVTLTAGYAVTMLSFRLFGTLSQIEMRLLLGADVVSLFGVGCGVRFFTDRRRARARRAQEFQKRHEMRIAFNQRQNEEIGKIIRLYDNNVA